MADRERKTTGRKIRFVSLVGFTDWAYNRWEPLGWVQTSNSAKDKGICRTSWIKNLVLRTIAHPPPPLSRPLSACQDITVSEVTYFPASYASCATAKTKMSEQFANRKLDSLRSFWITVDNLFCVTLHKSVSILLFLIGPNIGRESNMLKCYPGIQ